MELISKMISELYSLRWDISNPNSKRQFSIEMISNMTELYILCIAIHILTDKYSSVLKSFQLSN